MISETLEIPKQNCYSHPQKQEINDDLLKKEKKMVPKYPHKIIVKTKNFYCYQWKDLICATCQVKRGTNIIQLRLESGKTCCWRT